MTRWLLPSIVFALCSAPTARADSSLAKEIAKQRGLTQKKAAKKPARDDAPTTATLDREALRTRLAKLADDPAVQAATRAEGIALARWGLIPRDLDYRATLVSLYTDQIDRRAPDPAWNELVATERALRDAKFDFAAFVAVPAGENDASLARRALVEGDGIALLIELVLARKGKSAPWDNTQVTLDLGRAMTMPTGDALDKAPVAIREAMLFPFRAGLAFVASLRRYESWSAVDAAYKRPPRSTEQILHPEKYAADEQPVHVTLDIPAELPDAKLVHSTVWGELGFALFLRAHGIPVETANIAAAGWAGDRVITVSLGDAGPAVGLARYEWDSEIDAIEAYEAAVRALDDTTIGATIDHADARTRWLALDGRTSLVSRQGTRVTIAVGVPAPLLPALTVAMEK
ncbi:MAG: hypothetical protein HOV81_16205 [Kofleriaceae bacterium]|nr:hypothetical protein [Kofleriaceae bacterium]